MNRNWSSTCNTPELHLHHRNGRSNDLAAGASVAHHCPGIDHHRIYKADVHDARCHPGPLAFDGEPGLFDCTTSARTKISVYSSAKHSLYDRGACKLNNSIINEDVIHYLQMLRT